MYKLTIIIPSRNETGLLDTLKSLFKHSKGLFEVIVVNDCTDSDKWTEPKERGNLRVLRAFPPVGFSGAIQMGINAAKSDNIYICGARTRFTVGWVNKTISHIEDEPETLFCVTNPVIKEPDTEISQAEQTTWGGVMHYYKEEHWFKYLLNFPNRSKEPDGEEIDCAYGGSYAMKKSWWTHIHGLDMIDTRGGCNQFLSLKTWMAGGKVKVMKDVIVGNIYRKFCSYPVGFDSLIFNRLMILGTLYGMGKVIEAYDTYKNYREFQPVKMYMAHMWGKIQAEHVYMKSIRKGNFNNHLIF